MTTTIIQNNTRAIRNPVWFVLGVWFLVSLVFALTGVFDLSVAGLPATLILGIAIPLSFFGVAYRFSESFRQFIAGQDIRPLILLHTWRMLGLGFVFLSFHDVLTPVFALPAGLGDAAVAVGALLLGIALYSGKHVSLRSVYVWNSLGLLDFVLAVGLGVLTRPGVGLFSEILTSGPMSVFPLVLIPGFVVPFYIITHWIIALNAHKQLTANERRGGLEAGLSPVSNGRPGSDLACRIC